MLSARDIATVATHLLQDYQVLESRYSSKTLLGRGRQMGKIVINFNQMLPGLRFERSGVDGLKTGTTILAGATFTAAAAEDDQRLIAIVMNAGDSFVDTSNRFVEVDRLLDYGLVHLNIN